MESTGFVLAGFVAGEGSFYDTRAGDDRVDGSTRTRFVFQVTIAERDRQVLEALQTFLGNAGYIRDVAVRNERWLPLVTYRVHSRIGIRTKVIPFCDQFLLSSAKRDQYERWRDDFCAYEANHPTQWGRGPSICYEPGCDRPVRGRGLCRSHYYRETGY